MQNRKLFWLTPNLNFDDKQFEDKQFDNKLFEDKQFDNKL